MLMLHVAGFLQILRFLIAVIVQARSTFVRPNKLIGIVTSTNLCILVAKEYKISYIIV